MGGRMSTTVQWGGERGYDGDRSRVGTTDARREMLKIKGQNNLETGFQATHQLNIFQNVHLTRFLFFFRPDMTDN